MPLNYFKDRAKIQLYSAYLQIFSTKSTQKLYFFLYYNSKSDRKKDFHPSFCLSIFRSSENLKFRKSGAQIH